MIYLYWATSQSAWYSSVAPPDICYHASGAVTDERGGFAIPGWQKRQPFAVPNVEPEGWAYALGYVPVGMPPANIRDGKPQQRMNDVFRLHPSRATGDARLEELWLFIRRHCDYGGASDRDIYPLLRAAYNEAKAIAKTEAQRKSVMDFAYVVARAGLGSRPDLNGPDFGKRVEQFIREHLE